MSESGASRRVAWRATATRIVMALGVAMGSLLLTAAPALACSADDTSFYETFTDLTCAELPTVATEPDTLGGLRLASNGVNNPTAWNTDTDFATGIVHEAVTFPRIGVSTLATSGVGTAATLGLPATLLPLVRDPAAPVLRPTAATVLDNDNVDDPAIALVGVTYVMWYSGTSEDGASAAIFRATSPDGTTWTRDAVPVLQATAGSFDQYGVYAPDIVYDAADLTAPFRMYYSGRGVVFGGIGYATSLDGITWTKYTAGGALPVPVIDHGIPGSADSFSPADPSVLRDGATWKIWYTGDDSNKKRVLYATSADGIGWTKGGTVIDTEGGNANITFGAFAPTVWKDGGGTYNMLLTGRKIVGGGEYQTKILIATSLDGISGWTPSVKLNPSPSKFDSSNLNAPDVLVESPTVYKLYYSGNSVDAQGNFHFRIGHATSANGSSWSKVQAGPGVNADASVLDIGAFGTSFDARDASGPSVVIAGGTGPTYTGFYSGTRGSDFTARLGLATSGDGSSWTKAAVQADGSLFALGGGGSFDAGGERDPSAVYDAGVGSYELYFTGVAGDGTTLSIGHASTPQLADGTNAPDNASWSARAQVLAQSGAGFDSGGVSHPSVVKDGMTWVMYYTGTAGGVSKVGRATAPASAGPFTRDASPVLDLGAAGTFDATSVENPVVVIVAAGDWRMLYTGLELTASGGTVRRLGYATSTDGVTWTRQGVVLGPSTTAYGANEIGEDATAMIVSGATVHVWSSGLDRTGRRRGDHATTPFPTPATPQPGVPDGQATYQLGDGTTTQRDFRTIVRASSGTGVTLWVSFLQPYGSGYWSDWFPVTATSTSQALNFLLTVHGMRWQARLSGPAGAPALDSVTVNHANVSLATIGNAVVDVEPPINRQVDSWGTLTVNASSFTPFGAGTRSATATVLDQGGATLVAATPLSTTGDTVIDISAISAPLNPLLRVRLDITGDGTASVLINSLRASYASSPAPAPPDVTLVAATPMATYGGTGTVSGTVKRTGVPLVGVVVTISAQPLGAASFATVTTAITDLAGSYRATVSPTRKTTYKATVYRGANEPTADMAVRHKLTLAVKRARGVGTFSGRLYPTHAGRVVTVEIRSGSSWKLVKRIKTGSLSSFTFKKSLSMTAKYRFRARVAGDTEHASGISPIAYVAPHNMRLTVSLSGRRATFTGKVVQAHPGGTAIIQRRSGSSWIKYASVRLSSRSTFKLVKKLAPGTYSFRSFKGGDTRHFPGFSVIRTFTVV